DVVVIGGGNSAIEEADFISKFAKHITIVHQFDKFQANKHAQEKIFNNKNIDILFEHEPRGFERVGDKMKVKIENLKSREISELETDGVFVFVGMKSNTELFNENLEKDQWGYLVTDEDKKTNIPGVYAIGDVSSKKYRQITTAIADGTIAAISITKEID
ncbi:MAG: NAD(P)/FAD-dependent oxidoreductase, partial [bacterium]